MPAISFQGINRQAFLDDLHLTLAESQRDVLEEAFKRADEVLKAGTEVEVARLAQEIASATGCSTQTAFSVLKCVTMLAIGPAYSNDTLPKVDEYIAAIFKLGAPDKGGLTTDEEPRLRAVLERLVGNAETIKNAFLTGRVSRGVLPMFQDLQATLELRSTRPPIWSEDEKQQSETPLDLIPIASMLLVLDSGEPRTVCFQATEQDLAELQRRVQKLQAELKLLKNRVQIVTQ